jgi:hypothetical protein
VHREEVHEDEVAALDDAVGQAREALHYVSELVAGTDDEVLAEVGATLLELSQRVEEEAAALAQGQPIDRSVATSLLAGFNGEGDDVFFAQVGAISACVEWDVEPDGAWARVQEALAMADSD